MLYLFYLLCIISGFMCVTSTNSFASILFLVLVFLCVSFIYILMSNTFLGILFLLVYLGAILVLFLYVIFMLDLYNQVHEKNYVYTNMNMFVLLASFGIFILVLLGSTSVYGFSSIYLYDMTLYGYNLVYSNMNTLFRTSLVLYYVMPHILITVSVMLFVGTLFVLYIAHYKSGLYIELQESSLSRSRDLSYIGIY